jgi:hypothetical protein
MIIHEANSWLLDGIVPHRLMVASVVECRAIQVSCTDEQYVILFAITLFRQGLNCQKISGVDICLFIVIVITHRRFSIINNGGGLKLTPHGITGHLFLGGLSKQLGGSTPQPPGNSNTVFRFAMYSLL